MIIDSGITSTGKQNWQSNMSLQANKVMCLVNFYNLLNVVNFSTLHITYMLL
jgi:hypothetical protein